MSQHSVQTTLRTRSSVAGHASASLERLESRRDVMQTPEPNVWNRLWVGIRDICRCKCKCIEIDVDNSE